ncbi:MAG TPA: polyprenyl synthetase family protein [Deltaproteobacteria bacterium]|nr:polyprenyl synthetase family protein [Deltaproteobacteria bacterium]
MAEGELKELEHTRSFHDRLDVYLDIIYLKTASLFELCSTGPGILADVPDDTLDLLASYGRSVGMAFQIVDDIINLCPDASDNKDAFNDILEGKSTLPLVLLFRLRPDALRQVNGLSDPEERKRFLVGLLDPEILRRSRDSALEYLDRAVDDIRRAGVWTEGLAGIPAQIIDQIDKRL